MSVEQTHESGKSGLDDLTESFVCVDHNNKKEMDDMKNRLKLLENKMAAVPAALWQLRVPLVDLINVTIFALALVIVNSSVVRAAMTYLALDYFRVFLETMLVLELVIELYRFFPFALCYTENVFHMFDCENEGKSRSEKNASNCRECGRSQKHSGIGLAISLNCQDIRQGIRDIISGVKSGEAVGEVEEEDEELEVVDSEDVVLEEGLDDGSDAGSYVEEEELEDMYVSLGDVEGGAGDTCSLCM